VFVRLEARTEYPLIRIQVFRGRAFVIDSDRARGGVPRLAHPDRHAQTGPPGSEADEAAGSAQSAEPAA